MKVDDSDCNYTMRSFRQSALVFEQIHNLKILEK